MRSPSTADLLTFWERGLSQSLIHRAVNLVVLACPEMTFEQVVNLSIGQRDRLLLRLQECLFGSAMVSVATCPTCNEQLELTFDTSELGNLSAKEISLLPLSVQGYEVEYRLPTSQDLLEIANLPTETPGLLSVEQQLLERCSLLILHNGQSTSVHDLPEPIVKAIATAMSEADPQADIQLALICPVCGHQWQALFDIMTFLWSEIHAWAKRVLREVHLLASAYGWREVDILEMSPLRRQLYLEMIGG